MLRGGWAESDASCHDGRLEGWREDSPQVLRWPQIATKQRFRSGLRCWSHVPALEQILQNPLLDFLQPVP